MTLLEDGRVLGERSQRVKTHSSVLMPNILSFLDEYGLGIDDIDGWGVAIGPGSFTGLRIGLATVLGLTFGRDVPVVGVGTLRAMAVVGGISGLVAPSIDARKKEIYTGLYRVENGEIEEILVEELAIAPEEWLERLSNIERDDMYVWGSGVERYRDLSVQAGCNIVNVDVPLSRGVARIARREIENGYRGKPYEPIYLRKSEAEINLEKKRLKID